MRMKTRPARICAVRFTGASVPQARRSRLVDLLRQRQAARVIVIDWKSNVAPGEADMRLHAGQLEDYLRATGAARGVVVYMTPGIVRWVSLNEAGLSGKPRVG